jgi:peptidoglycan/xylan/chitin deacetylase (PgdA/CDA1 family)
MHIFPHRVPAIIKWLYKELVWNIKTNEKTVYLTFDDGPIPDVTPFVLDTLKNYGAKATFFCVGENIFKNPEVFNQIVKEGHTIGNHTFNHLNGWKTNVKTYYDNIMKCENLITKDNTKKLFRPPYGRITSKQIQVLRESFKIIMWDVLSADYEKSITAEQCLRNTLSSTRNGSIVLFHDHVKTFKKIKYVLPKYLEELSKKGYTFKAL